MRTLLLSLIMACTACTTDAGTPPELPAPQPPTQPAPAPLSAPGGATGSTLEQIRAMIGNATCNAPSQCRTLPVGARACGGPEAYLPYSTANLSEPALQALAERYKAEREAQNQASGMMSNCRFIPDPGAVCRAGTCQLGTGASPAS
jgi:hypothetical protein